MTDRPADFAKIIDLGDLGQCVLFKQRGEDVGEPVIVIHIDSPVGIASVTLRFEGDDAEVDRDEAWEKAPMAQVKTIAQQLLNQIEAAMAQADKPQIIVPPGIH